MLGMHSEAQDGPKIHQWNSQLSVLFVKDKEVARRDAYCFGGSGLLHNWSTEIIYRMLMLD